MSRGRVAMSSGVGMSSPGGMSSGVGMSSPGVCPSLGGHPYHVTYSMVYVMY